jgi:hypothetical protein
MRIPSLESVYQAMVLQNNTLNKQRAVMADIARRAQEQGKNTQIPLISSAVLARVREKEDAHLNKGYVIYLIFSHSLLNLTSVYYEILIHKLSYCIPFPVFSMACGGLHISLVTPLPVLQIRLPGGAVEGCKTYLIYVLWCEYVFCDRECA